VYDIRNLSKVYNHRKEPVFALRDVTWKVEPGSFTAVTGPSGSGKTTLLLSLGGLIRPSSGELHYGDLDVYRLPAARLAEFRNRSIGFVLQSFNLVPYLCALENVMLPMIASGRNGSDPADRAASLLGDLGLSDRMDFLPRELSVGQQQRVAIARALANDPDVILADEPTGNLDPALSDEILNILEKLNRERGKTIVMVTHSPRAAERAGTVLKLVEGRIEV
jgi:putative ABC transport system ATP-binding protein